MPDLSSEIAGVPIYPTSELKREGSAEKYLLSATDMWRDLSVQEVAKLEKQAVNETKYEKYVTTVEKAISQIYKEAGLKDELKFAPVYFLPAENKKEFGCGEETTGFYGGFGLACVIYIQDEDLQMMGNVFHEMLHSVGTTSIRLKTGQDDWSSDIVQFGMGVGNATLFEEAIVRYFEREFETTSNEKIVSDARRDFMEKTIGLSEPDILKVREDIQVSEGPIFRDLTSFEQLIDLILERVGEIGSVEEKKEIISLMLLGRIDPIAKSKLIHRLRKMFDHETVKFLFRAGYNVDDFIETRSRIRLSNMRERNENI